MNISAKMKVSASKSATSPSCKTLCAMLTAPMNRQCKYEMTSSALFGKAVWLFFAKAKEKQRNPQANASCFTFAFAQPHKKSESEMLFIYFSNHNQNKNLN